MHILKAIVIFTSLPLLLICGCNPRPTTSNTVQGPQSGAAKTNFQYKVVDLNGHVTVLGEFYENMVRNGEWRHFDQQQRLVSVETFRNDTLHGPAALYYHANPNSPTRLQGSYQSGLQTGPWELWQSSSAIKRNGRGKWKKVARYDYDETGRLRTRYQLHPNGKVALELSMSISGQDTHYRKYSRGGELIDEGKKLPDTLD